MDFAIPTDHRVKIKESEKTDKYLNFTRELKNVWNMGVTVILTVVDVLLTVSIGLEIRLEELEIKKKIKTNQTTALLKSTRIPKRVLET